MKPIRADGAVSVTIDGVKHEGTYYLHGKMVHVQSSAGTKATQVGNLHPETTAKLLLSELVRGV